MRSALAQSFNLNTWDVQKTKISIFRQRLKNQDFRMKDLNKIGENAQGPAAMLEKYQKSSIPQQISIYGA
jgi:hypothetical protein